MDVFNRAPPSHGKRARNRAHNRAAILKAARDCFQAKGYEPTTIRDIVRGSGLAAGTFYNYFSSKPDIFAALLEDFLTGLNEELSDRRQSARTARDFIFSTYHTLYLATAREPVVYELAHQNQRALRNLFGTDILGLTVKSLEQDVRAAMADGRLPQVDFGLLCAAFFGVAFDTSLLVARRARQQPDAADQEARKAAEFATNLFMGGLPSLHALSSASGVT
ncbi:MAG: TetR family transcriptional regulator [Marinobacter sp. 34-60-7]|nr:MAG: TetR family transcriptional regulator [Marinobacter sp. 34-60-7]